MTSTATETAPNGTNGAPSQSSVARIQQIPLVNDTLKQAEAVVKSNTYSAAAYDKATGLATQVYKATEPIQNALQPQIQAVDGLANRGLDFVEKKFPYVFETSSDKIIGDATKPANDAAAAARARFQPVAKQFSAQLESASASLHSVQDRLASAFASLPRSPQEAHAAASSAASSVLAEIERIRDNVAAQAKELPTQLQTLAHNVLDHLSKGANEIRAEIGRTDAKASERAQNVLKIAQSNAQPVISETLQTVKSLISAGEKKADEAASAVESKTEDAKAQVNGAAPSTSSNSTADSAVKKADEATAGAKKAGKKASKKAQDAAPSS